MRPLDFTIKPKKKKRRRKIAARCVGGLSLSESNLSFFLIPLILFTVHLSLIDHSLIYFLFNIPRAFEIDFFRFV